MFRNLFYKSSPDYRKFRWFYTKEENLVVGGKNEDQNELVINSFLKPNYKVVHTTSPGSPFMILQSENASDNEIKEMAVFCASFSKKWKTLKSANEKVKIDVFNGNQIYKIKGMKTGTFGVNGEKITLNVKPEIYLVFQKGKLRAIPKIKSKGKKDIQNKEIKILAEIKPGKMDKDSAIDKIFKKLRDKFNYPISKDEIASVIPSDKMSVK